MMADFGLIFLALASRDAQSNVSDVLVLNLGER